MIFPHSTTALTLLCLPLLLGACTAQQEPKEQASTGAGCDASRADHLIGQYANGYNERQAMQDSGATVARTLGPNDAATMDFNPARINIHTDPGQVIIKLACG